jgi:hypothetical protein
MSSDAGTNTSDCRRAALRAEQEFIAAAEAAMAAAPRNLILGTIFEQEYRDHQEAVSRAMIDRRLFGVETKHSVPQGRTIVRRGYARRFLFGRKKASVTIATVLAPPGPLFDNEPRPVTLAELSAHVRDVVGFTGRRVQTVVVVCSPTGFAPEVYSGGKSLHGAKVIAVAPNPSGGWRTAAITEGFDPRLVRMFDPEAEAEKRSRVRREIEERRAELLLGGVSTGSLVVKLNIGASIVEGVMAEMCRSDPELRLSRIDGQTVLYRGEPGTEAQEDDSMSVREWIASLFSSKGDEPRQINQLTETRIKLAHRRDRIYEDISRLEKREQALIDEGRQSTSSVVKRRVASQVAQLRKDISRLNTTASMLNQQINVLSTDIHNLTLLQQGQMAKLPSAEELTEHAVAAEEMLETLGADAKMVEGLEAGIAQQAMSDDEAAILRELEQGEAKTEPTAAPATPIRDEPLSAKPAVEPVRTRTKPQAE